MHRPIKRRLSHTLTAALTPVALLLTACSTSSTPAPSPTGHAPNHTYTFTVDGHGAAAITWSGNTSGTAPQATLPWHTTVRQSAGTAHPVTLTVVLGTRSGHATCAIAIDGRQVSTSLATGPYGRATCHTPQAANDRPQPDA